jgi:hypothetical protein
VNWAPRRATVAISAVLVILGVAIHVETAIVGVGIGYLLGAHFASAGALRLYLSGRV